ncbi:MAG TPA: hypothetical protein VG734_13375 [Lacunisphaera sp.]|nr:hypothetical protein [Lacunisphaera sp.]
MPTLKIHLENAELDAVERLAGQIAVRPEDVVYAALNRLMLRAQNRHVRNDIVLIRRGRQDRLPAWTECLGPVPGLGRPVFREPANRAMAK